MNENKIIEEVNEGVVTNSKGGMIVKIAIGAVGALAAVGTALFLKNRKNNVVETEVVVDNDDNNEQE